MLPRPAYLRSAISASSRKPSPTARRCYGPAAAALVLGRPSPPVLIDRSAYSDCTPANFARGMRDARGRTIRRHRRLSSALFALASAQRAALAVRRAAASLGVADARLRRVLAAAGEAFRFRSSSSISTIISASGARASSCSTRPTWCSSASCRPIAGRCSPVRRIRRCRRCASASTGAGRSGSRRSARSRCRRRASTSRRWGTGRFRKRPPTSFSAATPRRIRGCGEPASSALKQLAARGIKVDIPDQVAAAAGVLPPHVAGLAGVVAGGFRLGLLSHRRGGAVPDRAGGEPSDGRALPSAAARAAPDPVRHRRRRARARRRSGAGGQGAAEADGVGGARRTSRRISRCARWRATSSKPGCRFEKSALDHRGSAWPITRLMIGKRSFSARSTSSTLSWTSVTVSPDRHSSGN